MGGRGSAPACCAIKVGGSAPACCAIKVGGSAPACCAIKVGGSASGVSVKGFEYGTEFKSLLWVDNIKFVQYAHSSSAQIPLETMSAGKNRVYVLVNSEGTLKAIAFYNKEGKLRRQIDLGHPEHHGFSPHVHIGYSHSEKAYPLTKSDKAYIEKVRRIWNQR